MVICPECGKDVKEAKFCSNCGAYLPKVEDANVGEVIEVEPTVQEENVVDAAFEEKPIVQEENVVGEVIEVEPTVQDESIDVVVEDQTVEDTTEEANETNFDNKSKFCANCGTKVDLNAAFCPQCGYKFVQQEKSQTKFCQSCGEKININAEICPHCGVRVANIKKTQEEKNVLLAAILSFIFPGLGHLYLGLNKKGISYIIAYIISAVLVLLIIGFVFMLIVWIWALIDSIKSTEAINKGEFVEDKLF